MENFYIVDRYKTDSYNGCNQDRDLKCMTIYQNYKTNREVKMRQEQIEKFENIIKKEYSNISGIAVLKDGNCVYENYFNGCTKASRFHVYSVTKSIVSILLGIALDKGCLNSVEQKVLDFYPEYTI